MFRLHEQTRRRVLLAAFCLLCVLPTLAVLLWGIARHWPGGTAREAQALSRQLGLHVSLTRLKFLRPGVALYEGLQLTDPETGEILLRCRVLEAAWGETATAQGVRKPALVLIASQPEIQAGGLNRLWQLLGRVLQHECGMADAEVRLVAADLTLKAGENSETLVGVQGLVESVPTGAQAQVAFRLAGVNLSEPIRIRVLRNRQINPPACGFELDTGSGALPCGLLAMGLETLRPLCPQGRFRGNISANQTNDGSSADWEGEVFGQLLDVDLGRLVSEQFPHKLSGVAQVSIQSAHFRHGRLEDAACTVTAGPGVIGRSLLDAAGSKLMLVRGRLPSAAGDMVPYQQLSLAVLVDANGIQLRGRCPTVAPGTVLVGREGPLLGEPMAQPQPVVALLQMLVPANDVQVPATRQTDWLIQHLPVPRIMSTRGVETVSPHTPLRLSRKPGWAQ